jgi:hypothetical protein
MSSFTSWLSGAGIGVLLTSVVLGRAISDYVYDIRNTVVEPAFEPILPKGGVLRVGKVNIKAGELIASTVQFGTMVLLSFGAFLLTRRLLTKEITEDEAQTKTST